MHIFFLISRTQKTKSRGHLLRMCTAVPLSHCHDQYDHNSKIKCDFFSVNTIFFILHHFFSFFVIHNIFVFLKYFQANFTKLTFLHKNINNFYRTRISSLYEKYHLFETSSFNLKKKKTFYHYTFCFEQILVNILFAFYRNGIFFWKYFQVNFF